MSMFDQNIDCGSNFQFLFFTIVKVTFYHAQNFRGKPETILNSGDGVVIPFIRNEVICQCTVAMKKN